MTDRYKGVYKHSGFWRCRIWTGDGECYLGHFIDVIDAARAFDRACIALRGGSKVDRSGLIPNCLLGWITARREGLNLDPESYKAEIDYLESVDFEHLVTTMKQDGVTLK